MQRRRSALIPTALAIVFACTVLVPRDAGAFFGDDVDAETPLIAHALELRPGDVVADVGAGDGSHAIAIAALVAPEGRVLATELDDAALAKIRRNVTDEHVTNVTILRGGTDTTNLPPGCCDAVLMRGVYHHLTSPVPIDASVFAALKPGGRFLVVDFPPSFWLSLWTPQGIPADRGGHGIPLDVLTREVEAAGFRKVLVDHDWPTGLLTDLYGVVFEKPGSASAASAP